MNHPQATGPPGNRPARPPAEAAWLNRIRELRAAGSTLDEARAIAGPMPHTEADIAGAIAYGILLAAFAKFGYTRRAVAAAYAAVAISDAFEGQPEYVICEQVHDDGVTRGIVHVHEKGDSHAVAVPEAS